MKKLILLILLCAFGTLSFAQNDFNDFNQNKVGDEAPNFKFKTLDGKRMTLNDFKGKLVLLNFFATW